MQAKHPRGFSIIELMVVVTTIGILALLGMPGIRVAVDRTEATAAANDIRVFTEAVEFYSTATGNYPKSMDYSNMPQEIANYLPSTWRNGTYSWYYFNRDDFIYIFVVNQHFTAEQVVLLDSMIDDGNISTGDLRRMFGGLIYLFSYSGSSS